MTRHSLRASDWLRGYIAAVGWGLLATVLIVVTPMLATGLGVLIWLFNVTLIAGPVWLVGVAVIGLPMWWCMDCLGLRTIWASIIAGAALTAAACALLGLVTALSLGPTPTPDSYSSMNGRDTVVDGQLTAYGREQRQAVRLWLPVIAAGLGSIAGAASGFGLWRAVYRVRRQPD